MMIQRAAVGLLSVSMCILAYWWYVLVWSSLTAPEVARVHFLNVGQGDAVLIETPNRRQVLVDAGRGTAVLSALNEVLSVHDRDIDIAVMTHPDADHIGGFIPVLDQYDIQTVIRSFVSSETGVYRKVLEEIEKENADVHDITRAYTFTMDGMRFDILWPLGTEVKETNAASVVLLVTHGDIKTLLTGDASAAVEEKLIETFPERLNDVDILKAGHHGSKTSTAASFLEHAKPNILVYSAGENNTYGHPHQQVLDRAEEYAKKYPGEMLKQYRTEDGTVSFCFDTNRLTRCDSW